MSTLTKAVSRASLSIAFGAMATGIAVAASELLLISKLAAGLLAIGLFFVGAIFGSMLDEWIRSRKVQSKTEQDLIVALEGLMDQIPSTATQKLNNEIEELSLSIKRLKARLAARGIRYTPPETPFAAMPAATSRDRSEALRMCLNAKKLLDFAINMGDSEDTINALTAEVDHWLHILNNKGSNVQGRA